MGGGATQFAQKQHGRLLRRSVEFCDLFRDLHGYRLGCSGTQVRHVPATEPRTAASGAPLLRGIQGLEGGRRGAYLQSRAWSSYIALLHCDSGCTDHLASWEPSCNFATFIQERQQSTSKSSPAGRWLNRGWTYAASTLTASLALTPHRNHKQLRSWWSLGVTFKFDSTRPRSNSCSLTISLSEHCEVVASSQNKNSGRCGFSQMMNPGIMITNAST